MENEIGVNKVDISIIFGNTFKNISEKLKGCKLWIWIGQYSKSNRKKDSIFAYKKTEEKYIVKITFKQLI